MSIKLVYSKHYEGVEVGAHPWPVTKYADVYRRALAEKLVSKEEVLLVGPASRKELARAHDDAYIERMATGTLSADELRMAELPYSDKLASLFFAAAEGTLRACEEALRSGAPVFHCGGGYHHAFAGHGSGFCLINDIAVGIRGMQSLGRIKRALVVDLDVHQGDGTAKIFKDDPSVFTFSIHQENNFPWPKQKGDLDIGLEDGAGDEEYLDALSAALPKVLRKHEPQLVVYVAGADAYEGDRLGGLALSMQALAERDRMVFSEAAERGAAVATVLAGGYSAEPGKTSEIHFQTLKGSLAAAAAAKAR